MGNRPLVVVAADATFTSPGAPVPKGSDPAELNAISLRLNADAARLSHDGELITVPGATHVSLTAVEAQAATVAEAIRRVAEKVRSGGRVDGLYPAQ